MESKGKGAWLPNYDNLPYRGYCCSECNNKIALSDDESYPKTCIECGAEMIPYEELEKEKNKIEYNIYTSYYSNLKNIPNLKDYELIQVSNSKPSDFTLAIRKADEGIIPDWESIVKPYKKLKMTVAEYVRVYNKQLDANENVLSGFACELFALKQKKNVLLLCYEIPEKFCHRKALAERLNKDYGLDIVEYGQERNLDKEDEVER